MLSFASQVFRSNVLRRCYELLRNTEFVASRNPWSHVSTYTKFTYSYNVTWHMVLGCNGLVINETLSDIDTLLENSGYPKTGDIPVLNRKIFKGQRVSIREHPYVVSIRRQHTHYLVGTLLTKNIVITVAHPLADVPPSELGVVTGECYSDRGMFVATVVLVILHQEFDPYTLYADIAMLRIYEDGNYKFSIKPIALVSSSLNLAGHKAFVTGWGRCDNTGSELCLCRSSKYYPDEIIDPMLRTVSFTMTSSNFYCQGYKRHEVALLEGMLCAGPAREDDPVCPCLGVPGAPLVVQSRLVGLLSWGFGCGYEHDLPLVYTSIKQYAGWILHNVVVMGKVKQANLTQLFQATKAYLVAEWFIKTRVITPSVKIRQDKSMEPLAVDTVLAGLKGTVHDVRDFISGGYYHTEKKNMYTDLIHAEWDKQKMLLNMEAQKKIQSEPFLPKDMVDVEKKWFPNNKTFPKER